MTTAEQARRAKDKLSADLLGRGGVVGVGTQRRGEEWVVALHVLAGTDTGLLPSSVDGIPVYVVQTDPFRAQPSGRSPADEG
jgi:hypothetical protein